MTANCHHLRYSHTRLKLAAQTFVAQIVKRQISDASPDAQAVLSLPKRNVGNWKEAVRGLWCLFYMLEREFT